MTQYKFIAFGLILVLSYACSYDDRVDRQAKAIDEEEIQLGDDCKERGYFVVGPEIRNDSLYEYVELLAHAANEAVEDIKAAMEEHGGDCGEEECPDFVLEFRRLRSDALSFKRALSPEESNCVDFNLWYDRFIEIQKRVHRLNGLWFGAPVDYHPRGWASSLSNWQDWDNEESVWRRDGNVNNVFYYSMVVAGATQVVMSGICSEKSQDDRCSDGFFCAWDGGNSRFCNNQCVHYLTAATECG